MKRLLTAIFAIALIGVVFSSCKKDDETISTNSITIEGTFTIGDKTFTNPTFDLGDADNLSGYFADYSKAPSYNTIVMENEDIDIGDNYLMSYNLDIYSTEVGVGKNMYMSLQVYKSLLLKQDYLGISSSREALATITKVDEVGGYIEGTFEGDFYYSMPVKGDAPFHLKGIFKVKRVNMPIQ